VIGLFWTEVAAVELNYLLHHLSIFSILSSKAASFDYNEFNYLSIDLGLFYYYVHHGTLYSAILVY
jgi:hypothetical protein